MAEIEYFYAAHSAFAYLGSAKFLQIAKAAGRRIAHKPFDLRRAMAGVGSASFGARGKPHVNYFFGREIERWSEFRGAPTLGRVPTHHANDIALPNSVLIAALAAGHGIDSLAHAMLEAHWRDDANLADPAALAAICRAVGLDPAPLIAAASSGEVQRLYAANTDKAIRRSVWGSPTYVVDGDMFYGQDRLELVERALKRPFAHDWPPR